MKWIDRFKKKTPSNDPIISQDAEKIFAQKRKTRLTQHYYRIKKQMGIIAYLLVLLILTLIYIISPWSKTPSITVYGNHYLSDIYAKRIVEDASSEWMLLNIPWLIQHDLEKEPWIKSAMVNISDNGGLVVTIEENQPLGYYMDDQDEPYVLFTDGSSTPLNSYTTDVLSIIPLIHDFASDQLSDLANGFSDVTSTMIESMAEIVRLTTSYDDNMIMILMADGNYFIGSRFSMDALNRYVDIVNHLSGSGHCLYSSDSANVVYTSQCPWEAAPAREPDYFLDCDGNPILDEDGNPIEIQYLTDANGEFIYDNHGNKTIVNPIELPDCEVEPTPSTSPNGDATDGQTTVSTDE